MASTGYLLIGSEVVHSLAWTPSRLAEVPKRARRCSV
jgi:hypothetical protein